MRVHHLNCGAGCPLGGLLMDDVTVDSLRGRLASHCLLLENSRELVLIDTGYGRRGSIRDGAALTNAPQ